MSALQEGREFGESAVDVCLDADENPIYTLPARQPWFSDHCIEGKKGLELTFLARLERPLDVACPFRAVVKRYLPRRVDLTDEVPDTACPYDSYARPYESERAMFVYVAQGDEYPKDRVLKRCGFPAPSLP